MDIDEMNKEQAIQSLIDDFQMMDRDAEKRKWNCVIRWYEWGYMYEIFLNDEFVDMTRSKQQAYEKLFCMIRNKDYEYNDLPF